MRSHPTELIARHAGELASRSARKDWLTLSLELSEQATEGTIRNFAPFTHMLLDGAAAAHAPAGSLENPTFEYR